MATGGGAEYAAAVKIAVAAEGERALGSLPDLGARDSVARVWIERSLGGFGGSPIYLEPLRLDGGDARAASAAAYQRAADGGCDGLVLFVDPGSDAAATRASVDAGLADAAALASRRIPAVVALGAPAADAWLGDGAAGLLAREAVRLAEAADLDELARACPAFARFRDDFARAFRTFDCVVAADREHGIGARNDLPWPRLPGDLKHFKDTTCTAAPGKRNAIVMGRKTWESVPPRLRPLPGRLNVVISRGAVELAGDARLARSLDDALTQASLDDSVDQIFVVGGAEIYRQAFAHVRCRDVVLTRIDGVFAADAHIPDVTAGFVRLDAETRAGHDAGLDYRIERWRRRERLTAAASSRA